MIRTGKRIALRKLLRKPNGVKVPRRRKEMTRPPKQLRQRKQRLLEMLHSRELPSASLLAGLCMLCGRLHKRASSVSNCEDATDSAS